MSLAPAAADHLASRSRRASSIFVSAAQQTAAAAAPSVKVTTSVFVFMAPIEPGIERSVNVFPKWCRFQFGEEVVDLHLELVWACRTTVFFAHWAAGKPSFVSRVL